MSFTYNCNIYTCTLIPKQKKYSNQAKNRTRRRFMKPPMLSLPGMLEAIGKFYRTRLMQKENALRIEKRYDALCIMKKHSESVPPKLLQISQNSALRKIFSLSAKIFSVLFFFLKDSRPQIGFLQTCSCIVFL